jgi:flagellar biosynthesis protein
MATEPESPPEVTKDSRPIDKDKQAVALTYEKDKDQAPRVSAKGKGYIAEQIITLAKEHGIEIRQDKDLVNILAKLEIGTPIPVEAYAAVAEILSYIYKANKAAGRK